MTRLTAKQREAVVELLRCAAWFVLDTRLPLYRAKCWLDQTDEIENLAIDARRAVNDTPCYDDELYRAVLLEAALRVERGEWP